jgi:hypothetical protein
MTANYNPSYSGIGEMLRADFMQEAMRLQGEEIMLRAIAIAPVGHPPESPHPGRYKASFHVRVHDRGGATNDRAEAVVYNDSPEALYVEYANYGQEPYRVLARAAFGGIHRK